MPLVLQDKMWICRIKGVDEFQVYRATHRLLLLGAGESGKSTLVHLPFLSHSITFIFSIKTEIKLSSFHSVTYTLYNYIYKGYFFTCQSSGETDANSARWGSFFCRGASWEESRHQAKSQITQKSHLPTWVSHLFKNTTLEPCGLGDIWPEWPKHRNNCKCCPVSLLIVRSQRLSWIQVLNCLKCQQFHTSSQAMSRLCHGLCICLCLWSNVWKVTSL